MKILLVDDDREVTDLYLDLMRARGHRKVSVVRTAEEAVTQATRQHYGLITLDLAMPGVSGLEVLALLRSLNPHAVIAVISGQIPDQPPSQLGTCADVVIEKPVEMEVLARLLQRAVLAHEAMAAIRLLGRISGGRADRGGTSGAMHTEAEDAG